MKSPLPLEENEGRGKSSQAEEEALRLSILSPKIARGNCSRRCALGRKGASLAVPSSIGLEVSAQIPRRICSTPLKLFLGEAPRLFHVAEQRRLLDLNRLFLAAASGQEQQ